MSNPPGITDEKTGPKRLHNEPTVTQLLTDWQSQDRNENTEVSFSRTGILSTIPATLKLIRPNATRPPSSNKYFVMCPLLSQNKIHR